jgi:hypothetical protein
VQVDEHQGGIFFELAEHFDVAFHLSKIIAWKNTIKKQKRIKQVRG